MKFLKTLVLAVALGVLCGCNDKPAPPPPVTAPPVKPIPPVSPIPPVAPLPPIPPTPTRTVSLTWSPVSNATKYIVERDGLLIGNTADTRFVDSNVAQGKTYEYAVASQNPAGVSDTTSITINV